MDRYTPMDPELVARVRAALDGEPYTDLEGTKSDGDDGRDSSRAESEYDFMDRDELGITHEFEAVAWYREAAAQGNEHAQFLLGLAHMAGEVVPLDYDEAVKWFRKAAEQGHPKAQEYLDSCLAKQS